MNPDILNVLIILTFRVLIRSGLVVFKDGKPSKKDYRHFNIKTVEGPDDFASMEEVVFRRYKRLLAEGKSYLN